MKYWTNVNEAGLPGSESRLLTRKADGYLGCTQFYLIRAWDLPFQQTQHSKVLPQTMKN